MSVDFSALFSIGAVLLSFIVGLGWSNSVIGKGFEKKAEMTITELFKKDVASELVVSNSLSSYRVKIAVDDRLVSTDLSALDAQLNKI